MPGPLPEGNKRRSNPPAIPTTKLPVSGRKGRPPNPPAGYAFGEAGQRWWSWAWRTPQAMAWDRGSHYAIARRAQLEDDAAALKALDPHALDHLFESLDVGDPELLTEVISTIGRVLGQLKALAGGSLAIVKEMREIEKRLGLDPKALAEMRWVIVADGQSAARPKPSPKAPPEPAADERRLRAV